MNHFTLLQAQLWLKVCTLSVMLSSRNRTKQKNSSISPCKICGSHSMFGQNHILKISTNLWLIWDAITFWLGLLGLSRASFSVMEAYDIEKMVFTSHRWSLRELHSSNSEVSSTRVLLLTSKITQISGMFAWQKNPNSNCSSMENLWLSTSA